MHHWHTFLWSWEWTRVPFLCLELNKNQTKVGRKILQCSLRSAICTLDSSHLRCRYFLPFSLVNWSDQHNLNQLSIVTKNMWSWDTYKERLLPHRFGGLEIHIVQNRWWQGIPGRLSVGMWCSNLACVQASFHRYWWTLDLDMCLGALASNLATHLESKSM